MPAATITGTITCALCGQVSVETSEPISWAEAQRLIRAHQRSEVCS